MHWCKCSDVVNNVDDDGQYAYAIGVDFLSLTD